MNFKTGECGKCEDHEVIVGDICLGCPKGSSPNANRTTCVTDVNMQDPETQQATMNWAFYAFFGVITAVLLTTLGISCYCCYQRGRNQRQEAKPATPYKKVRPLGTVAHLEEVITERDSDRPPTEEYHTEEYMDNGRPKGATGLRLKISKTPNKPEIRGDDESIQKDSIIEGKGGMERKGSFELLPSTNRPLQIKSELKLPDINYRPSQNFFNVEKNGFKLPNFL